MRRETWVSHGTWPVVQRGDWRDSVKGLCRRAEVRVPLPFCGQVPRVHPARIVETECRHCTLCSEEIDCCLPACYGSVFLVLAHGCASSTLSRSARVLSQGLTGALYEMYADRLGLIVQGTAPATLAQRLEIMLDKCTIGRTDGHCEGDRGPACSLLRNE